MKKSLIFFAIVVSLSVACSKQKSGGGKLKTGVDSVAYIIGMNVGANLMKMDSTLNIDAVCSGIRDVFHDNTKLSVADARTAYLRWVNYTQPEKARAHEDQFLEDIRQSNRSFARTKSGVTYTVDAIGNEQNTPVGDRDTVEVRYLIRTSDGVQVYSSYEKGDTLRSALSELRAGLRESVKMIGSGGKIRAWMPAAVAYGETGDEKLGIHPNATLYYEIELVGVEKYSNRARSGNLR